MAWSFWFKRKPKKKDSKKTLQSEPTAFAEALTCFRKRTKTDNVQIIYRPKKVNKKPKM